MQAAAVLPGSDALFVACFDAPSIPDEHLGFADNLDLEPSSCSLRMTRKRLYLSYHKVCASQTKGNCEWAQEEVAKMGNLTLSCSVVELAVFRCGVQTKCYNFLLGVCPEHCWYARGTTCWCLQPQPQPPNTRKPLHMPDTVR